MDQQSEPTMEEAQGIIKAIHEELNQIVPIKATPWVGDRRGIIGRLQDQIYVSIELKIPLGEVGGQKLYIHGNLPLGLAQLWASDDVEKHGLDEAETVVAIDTILEALHQTLIEMDRRSVV